MTGCYTLKYPTGRWGFCGRVPAELAYKCSPEDAETARMHGPGLARRIAEREGREFITVTFESKEAADAALAEYTLKNGVLA